MNIIITVPEDLSKTTNDNMALLHQVEEDDCRHFATALDALGYQTGFANWADYDGQFHRVFAPGSKEWHDTVDPAQTDLVFFYKMEGFLDNRECFLQMVSDVGGKTTVINHPTTIQHNISKRYLLDLAERGIPTIPTYSLQEALDQAESPTGYILKPWIAERGKDQYRAGSKQELEQFLEQHPALAETHLAQPFDPSIRHGERSLVYLGYDFEHAVIKIPQEGDYQANGSQGAKVEPYNPEQDELELAEVTLKAYPTPVFFSRIDITRDRVMEAECLNPSVFANWVGRGEVYGKSFAHHVDEFLRRGGFSTKISTA